MHNGKSYYALAVRDQKLGEQLLKLTPTLTRPQLSDAKLAFKRAVGYQKFDTEAQANAAFKNLSPAIAEFVYVAEHTPVYGIL